MQTSGYIPIASAALYATVFEPENEPDRGLVLVPPFGQEAKSTVRVYTRLARALTERACRCVRFDLRGTGESGGRHDQADWQTWVADVRAVMDTVPPPSGSSWTLLGTRLGANLALAAAARHSVGGVALIEPALSGKDFLDDLLRRRAIRSALSGGTDADDPEESWSGGHCVDFGGYPLSPAGAAQLRELELDRGLDAVPESLPVALFRVAATDRVRGRWAGLFDKVRARENGVAESLRDKPFWGQVEYYESDILAERISRWVT